MIRTHAKPETVVKRYVKSVTTGTRVVGMYERLAVERYQHDLEHASERGWYFDRYAANHACSFFPDCLTHTLGEWADEPFHLSPWQMFCIWNVHGWRSASEKYKVKKGGKIRYIGARRFRKAWLTMARKNGKTTVLAGEANHLTFDDLPPERGGRGFCAATKLSQANLLFGESSRMIGQTPDLAEECEILGEGSTTGVNCAVKVTNGPQRGTQFIPIGSDSATTDGLNPSFVMKDEQHEWRLRHRALDQKLSTGGASRRQPLEWVITTAGDDDSEIWEEDREFACRVVEGGAKGEVIDDTLFAFICELDPDDDIFEESNWPKANPSIGESCKLKYLRQQANEAKQKPSALTSFTRYNMNRRVGSFDQAYPPHLWKRGNQDFPEPVEGDLCFVGFDVGRTNDWASWGAVWPQQFTDDEGVDRWRYKIKAKAYCCKGPNVVTNYSQPPYSNWIKAGLLGFQTDELIDVAELKADVLDLRDKFDVRSVPYDDSFAKELALDLFNNHGVPVFSFYQTHLRYNEALIAFEDALTKGLIDHGNCPVLSFQAANCQYHYDAKGKRMLDKGNLKRWKKIDSMVAIVMAFAESLYSAKNDVNDDILIG